jgi:hypothetical protein
LAKCTAITRGGSRCKGIAIDSSGYCHAHHPDRAEQRKQAASRGGKRAGRGRPQAEISDIKRRLLELADAALEGELDKGVAAVTSQILNIYLRAVSVELKVKEEQELEVRLEELELLVEQQKQGRSGYGA